MDRLTYLRKLNNEITTNHPNGFRWYIRETVKSIDKAIGVLSREKVSNSHIIPADDTSDGSYHDQIQELEGIKEILIFIAMRYDE